MLESVWIIPFLAALFGLLAFFIGHFVALADNQVLAWYALISDGGAHPPASCIFGQLLNMSAMFLAATVYIRHLQIVLYYKKINHVPGHWRCASTVLMYIGYVGALGTSIVANFQKSANLTVHTAGAVLAFGGGVIYCWGQVIFVAVMKPHLGGLIFNLIRSLLALTITATVITLEVFTFQQPHPNANGTVPKMPRKEGVDWVEPDSPFYRIQRARAVSEWIMGIGLFVFLLTFGFELWKTSAHAPKLILNRGRVKIYSSNGEEGERTEESDVHSIQRSDTVAEHAEDTKDENPWLEGGVRDGAVDRK